MSSKSEERAVIRQRLQGALDHIQMAQNHLTEALERLSPIIGALPAYENGQRLYEQVHRYWYRVRSLTEKDLCLDHEIPAGRDTNEEPGR